MAPRKPDIRELLQSDSVRKQVALAMPSHMKPDRMMRVMLTTINSVPKLLTCSKESLLSALMRCSQYGLEPDGRHAHLIPYGDTCQLIFDYKGLVNLVRRSGEVSSIHCDVVYAADEFECTYGSGGRLVHVPNFKAEAPGDAVAVYSFVKLKDGSESYEVLSVGEVNAIRDNSQGYQAFVNGKTKSNPWDSNWAEMAKKTAFRRHTKWLPLSFELAEAINSDDDKQSETERRFAAAKTVIEPDFGPRAIPAIPAHTAPDEGGEA